MNLEWSVAHRRGISQKVVGWSEVMRSAKKKRSKIINDKNAYVGIYHTKHGSNDRERTNPLYSTS